MKKQGRICENIPEGITIKRKPKNGIAITIYATGRKDLNTQKNTTKEKKCNNDCFNCIYDDCILTDADLQEKPKKKYKMSEKAKEHYKEYQKKYQREHARKYYLKYIDKVKERHKKYYEEHREKIIEQVKANYRKKRGITDESEE